MKKFNLYLFTAAFASVFAFSSCLGDSDDSNYPAYRNVGVTVGSGGFRMLADNGSYLVPTTMVTGLENVERAAISFDLASGELAELKPGKSYDVIVNTAYSYVIPTYSVIDLKDNAVAVDSLVNSQTEVTRVNGMYAVNGYMTMEATLPCDYSTQPTVDVAYNSAEDIDVQGEKLTLTLYYDAKSSYAPQTVSSIFSFRLPASAATAFYENQTDSIELVLNYQTSIGAMDSGTTSCRMAVKDLQRTYF